MWPFKSVSKLGKSGMLEGMTDWHSHILPGVDDGIRTMEESLSALAALEAAGVRKLWLTPHIMEDCPNTTQKLRDRFEQLKKEYTGNVELHLAAENMLDSLFEERLKEKDFLPLGEKGEHLLVETSYVNPPIGMDEMIDGVFKAGLIPVLAHPERYRYMEENDYRKWKDRGVRFQANYMSLLGGYGQVAQKKIEWMLEQGMIDMLGSDLHRKHVFDAILDKRPKSASALSRIIDVAKTSTEL
ncbi:MAG: capsular biosynthesis protein [Muribaculaceae bacterium]|nr:capsular biosynthesis protein [Muribaculaceae bacterium]